MVEFELVVAEEYKFESWANWKKQHFLEFSDCQNTDAGNIGRQISHRKPLFN